MLQHRFWDTCLLLSSASLLLIVWNKHISLHIAIKKLKTFYVIIYCILFFTFNFSDPRYEIRCCHSSISISLGLCWRHSFSSLHIADKIPFKPLCLAVMLKNKSELHVYSINKNRPKNHIPCCHTLYTQHIPLKIIILTTWINIIFPFE